MLFAGVGAAQSVTDLQALRVPRGLCLSPDGGRLSFLVGSQGWEIATAPRARAVRADGVAAAKAPAGEMQSPDGRWAAFLKADGPAGALQLYCRCDGVRRVSELPLRGFQWAADSRSFWVLASRGADVAVGRLGLDGRFDAVTSGAALRGLGGLAAANDVVAWVQSDGAHHGTIWVKDREGRVFPLWEPNPQTAKWSEGWTQEVVRWKNAHGEELEGVFARPRGRGRVPLIVDPYSGWHNRFLNIGVLGNYAFVRAGFAVFFPNHRALHAFPGASFGAAYVGASGGRDPVAVLTDDVMSGVGELVRRGEVDGERMFLYSFSTGASAIDQLLTETRAFRAAVSYGGVADWLTYYQENRPRGDETIPNFLGGRRPEEFPELYERISPVRQAGRIRTPLLLFVGDGDSIPSGGSRYRDAVAFAEALRGAGAPVELVVYERQGHGLGSAWLAERHVKRALEFFRAHMR